MAQPPPIAMQPQPGGMAPMPAVGFAPGVMPQGYPQPMPQGYPQPIPGGMPQGQQPIPGMPPGPQPSGWNQAPPQGAPPNCPQGLEYMAQIDQLLVKQKVELLEAFTGFETNNKYEIMNTLGQRVYYAAEETNFCVRNCCGAKRPFKMRIYDNTTREVIRLHRKLRCQTCCFPCCLQKMEVEAPLGVTAGFVKQTWHMCVPRLDIQNADGVTVLKIKGPCCTWHICGDISFQVVSADGSTQVGKITKQWSGLAKEMFTDADNFGISFPMDLDPSIKAVVLASIFLIDFMYYETTTTDKGANLHK